MPGARLPYHYHPRSAGRGLMNYPLSGVYSGAEISLLANGTVDGVHEGDADNSVTDLALSAGEIVLDGHRFSNGAVSPIQLEVGVDLTDNATDETIEVFLVPTRKVPAIVKGDAAPGGPADGDMYWEVVDYSDYQIINRIMKYDGDASTWKEIDDVRDIPNTPGNQNDLEMNQCEESISAANFTLANEKPVYHKTALRPDIPQHNLIARHPGGFRVAKIRFDGDGANEILEGVHENDRIRI